ncbi:universal stress protein [Natronolimnobius baerhuensis]|uniref:Universal stress protein UspA n=1 Tax=Natronolimnobius baerhuensis TaxID=253108 RepID=A0A202E578_9EURY|nr:universal stress protein [Natronolimnobius baerhuensis]OVE83050.1 universal stress protein UspA [Natronolimnobius baerhuensis]
MAEHILVPVDGSPLSRRALEVACEEYSDGEISALHVIDPTEPGYSVYGADPELARAPRQGSNDWYSTGEEHAEELFAELEEVTTAETSVRTETVVGRPDREILSYAADNDIDQIIMGSHGRSDDSPLLLGATTEAVVFRSPVRVSVIR